MQVSVQTPRPRYPGVTLGRVLRVLAPSAATLALLAASLTAPASGAPSTSNPAPTSSPAQLKHAAASVQLQINAMQRGLNRDRASLLRYRGLADGARSRLASLVATETAAQRVLARRLINTYESARPDIVSVVLESQGFSDLLNRLAFAQRIQDQDTRVVARVRVARRAVAVQATVIGSIEVRQQTLATKMLAARNGLYRARVKLVHQELAAARRQRQLSKLQQQLTALQIGQATQPKPTGPRVTPRQTLSGGGFTFPLPKGAAAPPATWTLDQGVDLSAPAHTPELAVGAGTIVLHGIGGFGQWAPVVHLDTGQYIYYGHAGSGNELPIGTHVHAGQVIGEVGAGIVGISNGPHLEIGFCDASGAPLGSQTAPRMLSLLRASY
jgi:murein DD-endopeptidase MepM/ murein hydrolase activator NlpD